MGSGLLFERKYTSILKNQATKLRNLREPECLPTAGWVLLGLQARNGKATCLPALLGFLGTFDLRFGHLGLGFRVPDHL